jgi:hypothetical protein
VRAKRVRRIRCIVCCSAAPLAGAAFSGCADPAGDAAQAFERAPYRIASGPDARQLLVSPDTVAIKHRGRTVVWVRNGVSYTWRSRQRCYDASTEFNRADIREQREAPWPDDVTDVQVVRRSGERVVTGRERHTDSADTELELTLDDAGRPRLLRVRSARWGVVPAGRWFETAYAYPGPERWRRSAGGEPRPICRA